MSLITVSTLKSLVRIKWNDLGIQYTVNKDFWVHACLGDVNSVPKHYNKVSIAVNCVLWLFGFPVYIEDIFTL